MDDTPKQITDIKPTTNAQPVENSQTNPSSSAALNTAPAQPQVSLGNPMPSALQSQAVHKAPVEEMASDSDQSHTKVNKPANNSHADAIKKTQKSSGGPAAIVTITVILMIILSALAIFSYLQQNK